MAKLNYQKLNQDSKQQSFKEQAPSVYPTELFFKNNNLWHLQGKYFGIHINKLPLNYLCWIIDTQLHPTKRQYREIAEAELYRRYNDSSNT